ncbi:DNA cytosine methyltransferase [Jeotgalibaca porci]|uniref:DNA cytosine methyltransferase n=1 Tax=Jeotgalibaca porci TaxID=1868793 RepID=UPI00359FBE8B
MIQLLELFGGIGAPRKALINLGVPHKSIDYVEFNEKAVRSYNAMFDNNYAPQDVRGFNLRLDILVHGSPCQDFSIGGKQYGGNIEDGTRSSLMFETIQIVKNLGVWKPKVVVWENVPNVLNKRHIKAFNHYIDDLTALGYTTTYEILDARDFGIPQARKRLFAISQLNGEWFNFEELETKPMRNINEFLTDDYGPQHIVDQPSMLAKLPGTANYDSYTRKLTEITTHALTITTKQMRCPNAGVVKLPDGNYRLLTELEAWRLMGFDDTDFYAASREHKGMEGKLNGALYHQAGNSMVVQVLEAIFKVLLKELNK